MFKYRNFEQQPDLDDGRQFLIHFYKSQYLMFTRLGIGGVTISGTEITEKLIQCTANRLDQLTRGKKTFSNMCRAERIMRLRGRHLGDIPEGEPALINSNRSFIGHVTSDFTTADLNDDNRLYLEYYQGHHFSDNVNNATHYIDKISTAYNSEIMQAILSHEK